MKIRDRVDLDHHPMEVMLKEKRRRGGSKGRKRFWRGVWNERGRKTFRERLGRMRQEEVELKKEWKGMEERMKEMLRETEEKKKKEKGRMVG